ncbi:hypothetical protein [Neobacillus muris]|uniref:hypothetical protein n=1 Tax=Neobacillus muris TaxID=2941334 RepID=UPI0020405DE9|nr:hypothetical protein [Neobacillus muris]
MDCIYSELQDVEDHSLIQYVLDAIQREEIRRLYQSICDQEARLPGNEVSGPDENAAYIDSELGEMDDSFTHRGTIGGQKEKQKENEKEK